MACAGIMCGILVICTILATTTAQCTHPMIFKLNEIQNLLADLTAKYNEQMEINRKQVTQNSCLTIGNDNEIFSTSTLPMGFTP